MTARIQYPNVIVSKCGECEYRGHVEWTSQKDEGVDLCRKIRAKDIPDIDSLPDWCPLPTLFDQMQAGLPHLTAEEKAELRKLL